MSSRRSSPLRSFSIPPKNRRGFSLALMALALGFLLGAGALAIDLGMLLTAHAEAQRVADSAALAGASAYLDFIPATAAVDTAQERALQYAMQNTIRNVPVQGTDVGVDVNPAAFTVSVSVRSIGLPMWFGSLLGPQYRGVTAEATAWAAPAGGVKCVKPFAIPDLWREMTVVAPEDANANRVWENQEFWDFKPGQGDNYRKWDITNPGDPTATGYGSQWRNQIGSAAPYDAGLILTIKPQDPNSGTTPTPGFFLPWRVGTSQGAQDYKNNITGCNPAVSQVGVPYDIEPGDMTGPTRQAITQVINSDPNAVWDPGTETVINSTWSPNWRGSPRVIIAGLFDPAQIAGIFGASNPIVFNDFALFFLEGFDPSWTGPPPQAPVQARFIGFAKGNAEGPSNGTLLRILRLID